MSDISKMFERHTVMVEKGSGVLINPINGDHSYIITARHNLPAEIKIDEIVVKDHNQQFITLVNAYAHKVLDLAVLITKEKFELSLNISNIPLNRDLSIYFFGYPNCRQNHTLKTNELPGVIQSIDEDLILQLKNPISYNELVGMSGGGIFHVENQKIFLCGIETKYGGDPNVEITTNVIAIPLNVIQNFITEKNLPELVPGIIQCFTDIIPETFDYFSKNSDIPDNVKFLKESLHKLMHEIIPTCTKPKEIHEELNEKLLAYDCSKNNFYNNKLWTSLLEFLIINKLIDNHDHINLEYIKNLSKKRKYIFIDSQDNWVGKLDSIYLSDLRGLMKGGIIIISSYETNPTLTLKPETRKHLIPHIGKSMTSQYRIDQAIKNPMQDFNIYHLSGLHNCIVTKEFEFHKFYAGNDGADEPEMHQLFIEVYREHITN